MRIFHRIAFDEGDTDIGNAMLAAGIEITTADEESGTIVVVISEDDPCWPAVARVASLPGSTHLVWTEFSKQELSHASALSMSSKWLNGYPEPSDDLGFESFTYDLSEYCSACGIGLIQKAPFRLRKDPKWGSRSMFQLNWVQDEFFVETAFWEAIFQPLGVACRAVVLDKTGDVLNDVVQLDISEIVELDMSDPRLLDVRTETCPRCGRDRYEYMERGFMPRPMSMKGHIAKSLQYEGTGASSNRIVYVSNELYSKIADCRSMVYKAALPLAGSPS